MKRRMILAGAAAAVVISQVARAQSFPEKVVRLVVPYPPGGPTDVFARLITQQLATQTGKSFIVENRPGAGGNIGVEYVASAASDGYTLLLSGPNITIAPALLKNTARFDPVASFTHVGRLVTLPTIFAVREESPHRSFAELLAYARAHPGTLTYGVPGVGSPSHIAAELLRRSAKVDIRAIPYRGSANAMTDLLGGVIDMVPTVASGALPGVKAKRLRALAVTSAQRDPQLPDVPAVAEIIPGFEAQAWLGISAPKGLPPEVQAWLSTQTGAALKDPKVDESLRGLAMVPAWLDPAQTVAMIKSEAQQYATLIREAGISAD